ncbi:MAG: sigma 54-interacting transcriptional regulator [Acidobacteriota bacterium]
MEYADEGTVFFDGIGNLSLDLQSKLLQAVEERCFTRVGENEERRTDCRLSVGREKGKYVKVIRDFG